MTEQQRRSLFFSATGKVATLNPFEYFIFCKGMDVEREACAKLCDELATQAHKDWKAKYNPHDDGRSDGMHECSEAIRARGQE